jgi:hypothetical protein
MKEIFISLDKSENRLYFWDENFSLIETKSFPFPQGGQIQAISDRYLLVSDFSAKKIFLYDHRRELTRFQYSFSDVTGPIGAFALFYAGGFFVIMLQRNGGTSFLKFHFDEDTYFWNYPSEVQLLRTYPVFASYGVFDSVDLFWIFKTGLRLDELMTILKLNTYGNLKESYDPYLALNFDLYSVTYSKKRNKFVLSGRNANSLLYEILLMSAEYEFETWKTGLSHLDCLTCYLIQDDFQKRAFYFLTAERKEGYLQSQQYLHGFSKNLSIKLSLRDFDEASVELHRDASVIENFTYLDKVYIACDVTYPPAPILETRIRNIQKTFQEPRYRLSLSDDLSRFSMIVVNEFFEKMSASEMVEALLKKYVPDVTKYEIERTFHTLTVNFSYQTLLDALKHLSDITGCEFFFDNFHVFHFQNIDNFPVSSTILSANNIVAKSLNIDYRYEDLWNYLYGVKLDQTKEIEEKFIVDGVRRTFSISQVPVELPSVKFIYNGQVENLKVGVFNVDSFETHDVLVEFSTRSLFFQTAPPATKQTIVIEYKYLIPFLLILQDQESIKTWGKIEHIIRLPKIVSYEEQILKLLFSLRRHAVLHSVISGDSYVNLIPDLGFKILLDYAPFNIKKQVNVIDLRVTVREGYLRQEFTLDSFDYQLTHLLQLIDERLKALEEETTKEVKGKFSLSEFKEGFCLSELPVSYKSSPFLIIDLGKIDLNMVL